MGGSIFIIPLLPFLSGLDPLFSVRLSLLVIFVISVVNSTAFFLQRLVLWSWTFRGLTGALAFSFLSGFFVTYLKPFQIRLLLWFFLLFLLILPWILKRVLVLRDQGIYIFSSLMGICSGLTGLGGGLILSPYLHESQKIPVQNIPAVVSCIMLFVSSFSLLGQISRNHFVFELPSYGWFCFFLLIGSSFAGLFFGHLANLRQKNIQWRKFFLRSLIVIMFVKLTVELYY